MRLTIATEARYVRGPDGAVVSPAAANAYALWSAYLGPFDSVTVLARVTDVSSPVEGAWEPAEGPGVRVHAVRPYVGVAEFARVRHRVRRDIRVVLDSGQTAWLARPPGLLTQLVIGELRRRSLKYAAEVVGDPVDVLRSGVLPVVGPLLAQAAGRSMARSCRRAIAASYVTGRYLQERYPPGGPLRAVYSSVDLSDDAFTPAPRSVITIAGRPPHLLTVGTHTQRYKGHDVLIDAVSLLRARGLRVRLTIVGEGRHQPWLRARAAASPAGPDIAFRGTLTAPGVRAALDACDVFVLPSRAEGLPRVLLEAMARGVPCVGSMVGGVPELLPGDRLVPPGDPRLLADRLAALLADPTAMAADSRRNIEVARRYSRTRMRAARTEFLTRFRDACAEETPARRP